MSKREEGKNIIKRYYNKAYEIAKQFVEEEARKILEEHPELDEFIMAMGAWFFTAPGNIFDDIDEDDDEEYNERTRGFYYAVGGSYWTLDNDHSWCKVIEEFMIEWDDYLKLTGTPMRFTAEGEKVTNW